jgi:hypothetical protein
MFCSIYIKAKYLVIRSPGKRRLDITKTSGWDKRAIHEVNTSVVTDVGSYRTP